MRVRLPDLQPGIHLQHIVSVNVAHVGNYRHVGREHWLRIKLGWTMQCIWNGLVWVDTAKHRLWKYTHECMYCKCKGRFGPQGSAINHEIPPLTHLGTHENGNGSCWSVDGDESASSSGLFIRVKHDPLGPCNPHPCNPHPMPCLTLRCNSTHCFNSSSQRCSKCQRHFLCWICEWKKLFWNRI